MKMLSLDDAIKAVTMLLDYEDDTDLIWSCDVINNLQNAPSVTDVVPGLWISVRDKLPDPYKGVLTCDKYSGVKENWLLKYSFIIDFPEPKESSKENE